MSMTIPMTSLLDVRISAMYTAKPILQRIVDFMRADEIRRAELAMHALTNIRTSTHVVEHPYIGERSHVVISFASAMFAWTVPKYLRNPASAVVFVQHVSKWVEPVIDTDEIVKAALAKLSDETNFAVFSSVNRRLAHRIIIELFKRINKEGD